MEEAEDLSKNSSRPYKRRLPATPGGFSVNFCRNPHCDQFGVFPDPYDGRGRPKGTSNSAQIRGIVSGSGEERTYICPSCGVSHSTKSNRAIAQEYSRIRRINRRTSGQHCKNQDCINHGLSVLKSPSAYRSFGKTAKGDPRFQCKACNKTFSIGNPTRRHKQTTETAEILKLIVNGNRWKRAAEIAEVNLAQIYSKIDYLYDQVLAFSNEREKRLHECLNGRNVYLSTDVQTILVNWPVRKKRGTIPLLHMATVHKFSQFVVASTVDYDPAISPIYLEELMLECGDFDLPRDMRTHARLWAASEYQSSLKRNNPKIFSKEDLAAGGVLNLPGRGCRVRGDAFQYAHMMQVKKLAGSQFRSLNYNLDAEAGLAAAVCALNVDLIKSGRVHVSEIHFSKGMVNDERLRLAAQGSKEFDKYLTECRPRIDELKHEHRYLTDRVAVALIYLQQEFAFETEPYRAAFLSQIGLSWPFHKKSEPNKDVKIRTDLNLSWYELARLFANASIHPVDAYFNVARRRVAGFERGIPTASNAQRIWHLTAYYNPEMVPKMAAILRFYYNYMLAGEKDGKTPAMRLGLAKGKVYARDLISYTAP